MMSPVLDSADAAKLQRCVQGGGVAVFPSDTVYGVCCDPASESAAARLYELKGRPPVRPAAVMFFMLENALAALPELPATERKVLEALLPGPLTLLVKNRSRLFQAACRTDLDTLGLRVPRLPESLQALAEVTVPVMQSSANLSGEEDARTLEQVPLSLREGADLVLDGGELPGRASTVIDLRGYAADGSWHLLREGAVSRAEVSAMLAALD
jgi:L-threonylcarbamoyladenylate synthase